ncbi:MAG TPA: AAA family ATPase [Xanthomonadaceae bacterium]|nr:AAA family ATPase [Xanthomonadaceae bacterium]
MQAEDVKTGERPLVLALMGLPGAGKSALAAALARELDLHVVDRDAIRAAMFPRCALTAAEKHAAFRAVLTAVEVNCLLSRSSVIDGVTFARGQDLERVHAVASKYPVDTIALYLDCPPELARQRIARDRREHPARDRSPDLVDRVMARFEQPPSTALVVDARAAADVVLREALALILTARGS